MLLAFGCIKDGSRGVDFSVERGVVHLRPDRARAEQRKDHAVGVLTGTGPAALAEGTSFLRLPLAPAQEGGLVGHGDFDLEADIAEHLLHGLVQPAIIGRRGDEAKYRAIRTGLLDQCASASWIVRPAGNVGDIPEVRWR